MLKTTTALKENKDAAAAEPPDTLDEMEQALCGCSKRRLTEIERHHEANNNKFWTR
ncbi:hypothetical protein CHS0354_029999 [Potamilus streckersoni]|uniref:Uncharacterized protein n=1 Tax=Potamilus streckersoni TaxID=2493646 RepID=A0AAE0VXQ7_9BIVA|nr:hypothetical protein CHS0354_029999 [Potamilus streckersoni]